MKLLEAIKERMVRLAELTADELAKVRTDILKCADQHDGDTADNIKILSELAGYADAVKERSAQLKAEQDQAVEEARLARELVCARQQLNAAAAQVRRLGGCCGVAPAAAPACAAVCWRCASG